MYTDRDSNFGFGPKRKLPGLRERKSINISNIDRLALSQSRGFGSAEISKFETRSVYFRLSAIIFFLCFPFNLKAAAPITHVYTAQIWMEKAGIIEKRAQEAFVVGSLFPDIRYLGTISRKATHPKGITEKKIRQASSPFRAGMLHHAMVDERREEFIKKNKILRFFSKIPKKLRVLFLKLLEDEVLWDETNCKMAQAALAEITPEEVSVGVERHVVELWHKMMSEYLDQRPSKFLALRAKNGQGFINKIGPDTAEEWARLLPEYAASPFVLLYVQRMNAAVNKWLKPL